MSKLQIISYFVGECRLELSTGPLWVFNMR